MDPFDSVRRRARASGRGTGDARSGDAASSALDDGQGRSRLGMGARAWFVFCGAASTAQLLTAWAVVVSLLTQSLQSAYEGDGGFGGRVATVSAAAFAGMLANCLYAASIPCREIQSKDRQARMAEQGGHTLMFAYFLGLGPLAEAVRLACMGGTRAAMDEDPFDEDSSGRPTSPSGPRTSPAERFMRALRGHALGCAGVQGAIGLWAMGVADSELLRYSLCASALIVGLSLVTSVVQPGVAP